MGNTISEIWTITLPILRSAVSDTPIPDACRNKLSPEMLQSVYAFAKKYDIAQIAAVALLADNTLRTDSIVETFFRKSLYIAVTRYEQMDYEIRRIREVFDAQKISYILLKGAQMRQYYPEPWMRTSCDVDILIRAEDTTRASDILTEKLSYVLTGRTPHDISFETQERKVHIELHHSLVEANRAAKASDVLSGVWEKAEIAEKTCRYTMPDELFYFYHIAHMAKHFEYGGCGVRPFIDLWILNHRLTLDRAKRTALLREGGLLKFSEACETLSEVWFGDEEPTELTGLLEKYVLSGGMYGNIENMVAVQKNQDGGRLHYIFRRLFMPYERLKNVYPILQKHKWLTPVMQLRRWYDMIATGRMKRTVGEIKSLKSTPGNTEIKKLLEQLEL